jgi:hypothetical protein
VIRLFFIFQNVNLRKKEKYSKLNLATSRTFKGSTFSGCQHSIGVQVDYNVVHLRTSLAQLFVLLLQNFEKLVQIIELKRFGGAPNGYPFAPLAFHEYGSSSPVYSSKRKAPVISVSFVMYGPSHNT